MKKPNLPKIKRAQALRAEGKTIAQMQNILREEFGTAINVKYLTQKDPLELLSKSEELLKAMYDYFMKNQMRLMEIGEGLSTDDEDMQLIQTVMAVLGIE